LTAPSPQKISVKNAHCYLAPSQRLRFFQA
jgi:hypothetical protein